MITAIVLLLTTSIKSDGLGKRDAAYWVFAIIFLILWFFIMSNAINCDLEILRILKSIK
jgi:hypothetical protein